MPADPASAASDYRSLSLGDLLDTFADYLSNGRRWSNQERQRFVAAFASKGVHGDTADELLEAGRKEWRRGRQL